MGTTRGGRRASLRFKGRHRTSTTFGTSSCLDPEGFIPFDLVAAELADAIDGESFLDFGTGLLKWRRSRQDPRGLRLQRLPPLRHHPRELAPGGVAGPLPGPGGAL
jgi:hypothetical protein